MLKMSRYFPYTLYKRLHPFPPQKLREGRGASRGRELVRAVERGGDDRGQSYDQPAEQQEDNDRREQHHRD